MENQYSEMTELPSNICNWDNETGLHEMYAEQFTNMETFWGNLVILDFTGSKIRKIPDINCLVRLDSLILFKNNINSVSNSSFTSLSRLRLVNLEGNRLKTLDPGIFTAPTLNIFFALFRDNEMEKLDVSNMFSRYPFCTIDFEDNKITHLVNEDDFKLDMDKTYGPGFVSFVNNEIDTFPNYKELLQLDSWEQIGKLFSFGFDCRGVPIICDCNLVPFLSLAKEIVNSYWLDYFNVTCTGPENHVGKPVHRIPLDELICPIPQHKGCQAPECTCVDRPQEDTLYIDCSYQNLKKLPDIPISNHSRYVSLNVSGNNIQYIVNMSYLPKLRSFDISKNDMHGISNDIAKQLENCSDIDISYNSKIEKLPELFQYRNICNTDMRGIVVACICETQWLETWVASRECEEDNLFRCNIPEESVRNAKDFHVSELGCFLNTLFYVIGPVIGGVALFLILTSTSFYLYRYELMIIYLRLRQKKRNVIQVVHKYDVFISFNDNEEHVAKWIVQSLEPRLRKSGYKTYIACKDMTLGADRSTEVKDAIYNSRNTLIVLSDSYLEKKDEGMRPWTENEWKFGWYNFKHDRGKNIVLVNFDHLQTTEVDHPVIKAYLRVGCTVDFTNHDRNIMDDIETKLGSHKNVIYCDDVDINDEIVVEEDRNRRT